MKNNITNMTKAMRKYKKHRKNYNIYAIMLNNITKNYIEYRIVAYDKYNEEIIDIRIGKGE